MLLRERATKDARGREGLVSSALRRLRCRRACPCLARAARSDLRRHASRPVAEDGGGGGASSALSPQQQQARDAVRGVAARHAIMARVCEQCGSGAGSGSPVLRPAE